jgi:hypothetical protein
MRFLCHTLTWDWCRAHGIRLLNDEDGATGAPRLGDDPALAVRARYVHPAAGERAEAEALASRAVAALGPWEACLVWVTDWDVWPNEEDWPRYYAWRGAHGERRSLGEAPGHLVEGGESVALTWLVAHALECGWDVTALPIAGGISTGVRLRISHDEWIAFHSATPVEFSPPAG